MKFKNRLNYCDRNQNSGFNGGRKDLVGKGTRGWKCLHLVMQLSNVLNGTFKT